MVRMIKFNEIILFILMLHPNGNHFATMTHHNSCFPKESSDWDNKQKRLTIPSDI